MNRVHLSTTASGSRQSIAMLNRRLPILTRSQCTLCVGAKTKRMRRAMSLGLCRRHGHHPWQAAAG